MRGQGRGVVVRDVKGWGGCGWEQIDYPSEAYPDEASLPDFEIDAHEGETKEALERRQLPDPEWKSVGAAPSVNAMCR